MRARMNAGKKTQKSEALRRFGVKIFLLVRF